MTDERELIRSRIDIVELVGQRVSLKKAGKDWKGLCPFHQDRNPSFHVSRDKGIYKCYACGAGGDVFTWVMESDHVDFAEALRILAKEAGIELKNRTRQEPNVVEAQEAAMSEAQAYFREQLRKSSQAQEYCESRGLDQSTLDSWGIGYAPDVLSALATHLQKKGHKLSVCEQLFLVRKGPGGYDDLFRGRIMFPIRNERGRLVAFGGRILGDGQPKYINSGDTPLFSKSRVLYGMDKAKEPIAESRKAVLVEGYLDVIACHRSGVNTAVASLGTALAEDHVRLLTRWCDEVTVLYDSDTAGQKAAERACGLLAAGGLKVRVASVPSGKDPDTLMREQGPEAVRRAVERPLSETDYLLEQLRRRKSLGSEEFWEEAAGILARGKKHTDVVGAVDRLAAQYPFTKDQTVARLEIERMVAAARRNKPQEGTPARSQAGARRLALQGAEATVFKALLVPELAESAWSACRRSELFVTTIGVKAAEAVASEFPEGPPNGPPSNWLPGLDSEGLKDVLLRLEQEVLPHRDLVPVERTTLEDAIRQLEQRLATRERTSLKDQALVDEEARKTLYERLKQAKGG